MDKVRCVTGIRCADGAVIRDSKLVATVPKVRSRETHTPPVVGEYPVLVEQSGSYRMFTYSSRLMEILYTEA